MWRNSMEIFHLVYEKQMTRDGISQAMKGKGWEVSDRWDWCCTEPELISFAEYLQKLLKVTSRKQGSIFMKGKNEMLKGFIIQSGQVVS